MENFKGENILDFMKVYPDNESCKGYLADLKWKDGFECLKCKGEKGCRKSNHSYYCYTCEHVETATANTLFHDVRFGLQKAFCMIFEMVCCSKNISSVQMSKRYGVTQGAACYFITPILEKHISKTASVITDKWSGYKPLVEPYNIKQVESGKGKNFKELHIIVHQVKTWDQDNVFTRE